MSNDPYRWWWSFWSSEAGHAFAYGFGILFVAAALASPYTLLVALSLLLWGLGIRALPFRFWTTGDKKPDWVDEDVDENVEDRRGVLKEGLVEIRHRTDMYVLGGIAGDRLGYAAHYLYHGHEPNHYDHLGEIIEILIAVM